MSTDSITAGQAQQLGQGPMETQDQPQAEQPQAAQAAQSGTSDQQAQMQAAGPPYAFDPHTTYSDPNVQAWAQYYAQGGKDPAGAVYFFSVPGVTDGAPQPQPQPAQAQSQHQQQHYQQHQSNAGSSASIGSNGAQVDGSASSSPEHSFQSHASEQQQAAAGADYAYSAGSTQAQPYNNRQPLSKASYSSLTSVSALPAATAGTAGQNQNQGSAATHTPSWVIPKKNAGSGLSTTSQPGSPTLQTTAAPVGIGGGYGAPDPATGGGGGQPYYSLPNQFATMSVADQQQHH